MRPVPVVDAATVKELVDRSFSARFQDRGAMIETASRAVMSAERNPAVPSTVRAAAWIQFGNSLRILGRIADAETGLTIAARYLEDSSDERTAAHLHEIFASLDRDRGQIARALVHVEEARRLHAAVNDPQGEARDLLLSGLCKREGGDLGGALESIKDALDHLTHESDFQLYFAAAHALVDTLLLAGRTTAAVGAYTMLQHMARHLGELPILRGKLAWLRGRLFLKLGQAGAARRAYAEALDLFEDSPELPELQAEAAAV